MLWFLKRVILFFYSKFKFRKFVKFSYSVRIGKNSNFEGMNRLYPKVNFTGKLGFGSYIGYRSEIAGKIGRYTSIGCDVKVIWGTHPYTYPYATTSPAFFSLQKQNSSTFTNVQRFDESLLVDKKNHFPVILGNDCWLGERSMIIGGVEIGDGAVVLAGAIVTKDVPPYAIVGGVPAKILRYRYDVETIDFLLGFKWWDKGREWLKANVELINDINRLKKHPPL